MKVLHFAGMEHTQFNYFRWFDKLLGVRTMFKCAISHSIFKFKLCNLYCIIRCHHFSGDRSVKLICPASLLLMFLNGWLNWIYANYALITEVKSIELIHAQCLIVMEAMS